jgi:transposase
VAFASLASTSIATRIARKPSDFAVQRRRWAVDRLFARLSRNRRLAKDFEATVVSTTALLYVNCVMLPAGWHVPVRCPRSETVREQGQRPE